MPLILFLLVNLSGLICSQAGGAYSAVAQWLLSLCLCSAALPLLSEILATDLASALASAAPAPPSPDKSLEALAEATIKRSKRDHRRIFRRCKSSVGSMC